MGHASDAATSVCLLAILDLPEIRCGDDLADILCGRFAFQTYDVLVVAQKVVSKAEGRLVSLGTVVPGPKARRIAGDTDKDPRLIQLILDESTRVVRLRPGLVIAEDRRGWVCANAGIDRSNVPQTDGDELVCLLPIDPDKSAQRLREGIQSKAIVDVGVIVNDSHGRAWRDGTVGVAIGAAGIAVMADRRGQPDRTGYVLEHTVVATADELAAAASLLMGQGAESVPAVVIRGLQVAGDAKAKDLQRPPEFDLFR